MTERYIGIVETAKIVRAALKDAFPGTRFSVRCDRYSMGSHLNIGWTDGPSSNAVAAIVDQFYGTGFDGMTDSTTYHDSTWNGEVVHFSGSRPNLRREVTSGFVAACGRAWDALSEIEQWRLTSRHDFPRWPENDPGQRLARYIAAPSVVR